MATRGASVMNMLKEIAQKEVDTATEALAEAMKIADEAQSKYDMLVEYRDDYSKNLQQSLEMGIGAMAYQNFQGFFRKLDQAVKGQFEMLVSAQHHVMVQKKRWKESQRKKLSYDVLEQRDVNKQAKVANKKEQRMMDEFAMRASRNAK